MIKSKLRELANKKYEYQQTKLSKDTVYSVEYVKKLENRIIELEKKVEYLERDLDNSVEKSCKNCTHYIHTHNECYILDHDRHGGVCEDMEMWEEN